MSFPPTVITTDTHKHKHEQEQDTCSHHGVGSLHAATLPRAGTGHVAQLCQDRDDARRRRYGLPARRCSHIEERKNRQVPVRGGLLPGKEVQPQLQPGQLHVLLLRP